jgi:hypothetical protein
MRAALAAHDDVLHKAIEAHGGFLFKHTGDGVCAVFASPRSAVDAAVAAQQELKLPVRMGIATGEAELRKCWNVEFDDAGAIGRRYRRQDEIGTPYCVTVDFGSLDDHAVAVRERDAMTLDRVRMDAVADYVGKRLKEWC